MGEGEDGHVMSCSLSSGEDGPPPSDPLPCPGEGERGRGVGEGERMAM